MNDNQPQPVQPKGSNRTTATIAAVLLGIAVVLLVVNGVMRKDKPADNGNQDVVVANMNTNTPVDTSDWKTYKNEEFGFEVKYPKEFIVKDATLKNDEYEFSFEMPEAISRDCMCRMSLTVSDNKGNLTITEWMKQKGFMTLEEYAKELEVGMPGLLEQKEIMIAGLQGIEYDRGMEGGGSHTVLIPLGERVFLLSGSSEFYVFNNANKENAMRKIYDDVLSSLVFSDKR